MDVLHLTLLALLLGTATAYPSIRAFRQASPDESSLEATTDALINDAADALINDASDAGVEDSNNKMDVDAVTLTPRLSGRHNNDDDVIVVEEIENNMLGLPSNARSIRDQIVDSFSCEGRGYGYYADVDNECQLFHVCLPVATAAGRGAKGGQTFKWSFICPGETIFNQESFTCTRPEDSLPCEESAQFYRLNDNFGVTGQPEQDVAARSGVADVDDVAARSGVADIAAVDAVPVGDNQTVGDDKTVVDNEAVAEQEVTTTSTVAEEES